MSNSDKLARLQEIGRMVNVKSYAIGHCTLEVTRNKLWGEIEKLEEEADWIMCDLKMGPYQEAM